MGKETKMSESIYSQSNQNMNNPVRDWNLALYWGPSENYKRKTKDYTAQLLLHEKEFEKIEGVVEQQNLPRYLIKSSHVREKFSELSDIMFECYSRKYSEISNKSLKSYIQSEWIRISLIFFNNFEEMKVDFEIEDEDLKKNSIEEDLLIEKYNENYIRDLIDNSKSSLKAYLYNFLHNFNIPTYMKEIESKEEEKSIFLEQNSQISTKIRKSTRNIDK